MLFVNGICGQESDYLIKRYTTADGLSNNYIRRIAQDKFGFLWIATWDGLSCYDGHAFKNYFHDPNDSASIPYFEIFDLCVDKENTVWVYASKLCHYDRTTDKFIICSKGSKYKLHSSVVYSIATDSEGSLYVFGNVGLEKFNYSTHRFDKINFPEQFEQKINKSEVYKISIDNLNNLWMLNVERKKLIHGKIVKSGSLNHSIIEIQNQYSIQIPEINYSNFHFMFHVHVTQDGCSIITSNEGLYIKQANSNTIIPLIANDLDNVSVLPSDLLWSVTDDGFYRYDRTKKRVFTLSVKEAGHLTTFFLAKDGSLWLGSFSSSQEGMGLTHIICKQNLFDHFKIDEPKNITDVAVFAIYQDHRQNTWVGTRNVDFLFKISPTGSVSKENFLSLGLKKINRNPRSFIEDKNKNLWIGYSAGLIVKYNILTTKYDLVYPSGKSDPQMNFMEDFKLIDLTNQNTILVAGRQGVVIIDPQSFRVLHQYRTISDGFYSCFKDSLGHFWLGGGGRLYAFDENLRLLDSSRISEIPYNIESICGGEKGCLWLGLLGGGLCKFSIDHHRTKIYSSQNGLINNTIYSLLKDKRNNIWITTNDGISMFNPGTELFVNYGEADGLNIREFNSDAAFKCADGRFLFGGIGGVVGFYPDSLINAAPPEADPVMITNMVATTSKLQKFIPVYSMEKVTLAQGTKMLLCNFSCLNFQNQTKYRFRYRIIGIDDHWVYPEKSSRTFSIPNITPGEFQLQLESADLKAHWNRNVTLTLIVPPFFYETREFLFLVSTVFLIIILTIIYTRFQHLKLLHKYKLAQLKLITAQSQLNPHFLSNSLSSLESFIADKDDVKSNLYIGELNQLMRRMIDYTGKTYIPFDDEIEYLTKFLEAEKIRLENSFDYEIRLNSFRREELQISPSMIQPFVENSIKHGLPRLKGQRGIIVIWFEKPADSHFITCYIDDNGVGRRSSQKVNQGGIRASKAIEIINERLKLYNLIYKSALTLSFEDLYPEKKENGTRVKIEIPIQKNDP